jgi:hypothetical protein
MKATIMDMRRNPKKILNANKRNEKVTPSVQGHEIAKIIPTKGAGTATSIADDPAVGMWADRSDMVDSAECVRTLRKGRFNAS